VGVKCRCTFGWSSRNVRTACVLWIEVVGDHVNYSPRRLRLHDVAEDLDKRGAGLRGLVVAEHLPEACPMPPGASACHGGRTRSRVARPAERHGQRAHEAMVADPARCRAFATRLLTDLSSPRSLRVLQCVLPSGASAATSRGCALRSPPSTRSAVARNSAPAASRDDPPKMPPPPAIMWSRQHGIAVGIGKYESPFASIRIPGAGAPRRS